MARSESTLPSEPRGHARVIAAAVVPLVVLFALFLADVRLGQPDLFYRFSPIASGRLYRALPALLIAGVGTMGAFLGWSRGGGMGRAGRSVAVSCYIMLIGWTFVAPPFGISGHVFNLESPSHEGAFVWESKHVHGVREYLAADYYDRLGKEPHEMRGRRVLSNPPGVTIAYYAIHQAVQSNPRLDSILSRVFGLTGEVDDPVDRQRFAASLAMAVLFTVLWGAAVVTAYHLCRLWLTEPAAIAVAFACVFNPSTVNFTPGKDPAQMLSVLAILAGWLTAYVRGRPWWAFAAGVIGTAATMVGLIHVWIFVIVAAATLWHALRGSVGIGRWMKGCCLPCACGACLVALTAWVWLDWNIIKTTIRVGIRFGEIQMPVITDPFPWTLVGVPLFCLFVGPMFWVLLTVDRRREADDAGSLGLNLIVAAAAVMTYAYFFANNSETPRLWMPFIPLLLVPMALRRTVFRRQSKADHVFFAMLIGLQSAVTVLHWAMMDVRETEYRLTTGRMWD